MQTFFDARVCKVTFKYALHPNPQPLRIPMQSFVVRLKTAYYIEWNFNNFVTWPYAKFQNPRTTMPLVGSLNLCLKRPYTMQIQQPSLEKTCSTCKTNRTLDKKSLIGQHIVHFG